MIKIKCHSQYNHFPNHNAEGKDKAFELWNDGKIWEYLNENKEGGSALLIEPRPLQYETYKFLETRYDRFKYIFTHDSQLLAQAPNARPLLYWNEYEINDEPKTKDISMICGTKAMCPLHINRQRLAEDLEDKIDVLGDWDGGERVSIHDAYAPYRFAVVIENYIDDLWFTEKILNAFANKTVPIYLGARQIDRVFNHDGIIQCDSLEKIKAVVEVIQSRGAAKIYEQMMEEIEENFKAVQKYKNFEDYFIKNYEHFMKESIKK